MALEEETAEIAKKTVVDNSAVVCGPLPRNSREYPYIPYIILLKSGKM